jgi:hypothetical protein
LVLEVFSPSSEAPLLVLNEGAVSLTDDLTDTKSSGTRGADQLKKLPYVTSVMGILHLFSFLRPPVLSVLLQAQLKLASDGSPRGVMFGA